jgi:hypothetical protein
MDTSLIILGVALVLVLYVVFFFTTAKDSLADKLDLAQVQTPILATSLTKPQNSKFSYEFWMYVYGTKENATSGTDGKYIFYRNASAGGGKNIGIRLNSTVPSLTLDYTASRTVSGATTTVPVAVVITDNLPLQSWVHVIVSVDNSYIDIYMNGKLVKSIKDTIATPSADESIQFEISKTYLAKFQRTASPTDPQTAWNHYLEGNGDNPIKKYTGDYNLALSFKKGEKDSDAWKLNILGGQ